MTSLMYFASNILAKIDPASGAASTVGQTPYSCLYGLSATPAHSSRFKTCNGELVKIDPSTGSFFVIATGLPS